MCMMSVCDVCVCVCVYICVCVINANPRLLRCDLEHHHRREMNRLGGGLRYLHLGRAEVETMC